MPIVNLSKRSIPFTPVTYDVVMRDGKPGEDNYPVDGLHTHILSKVDQETRFAGILQYFTERNDYDFTVKGKDDIDPDDLREYVEQLLYGYKRYSRGPVEADFRKYNSAKHYNLVDPESGDLVSESEFAVEEKTYTMEDLALWRKKLPYLIKRLSEFGRINGVFIITAIKARQECIKAKENIKPANLLKHDIIIFDSRGLPTILRENVGTFQRFLQYWLRGDDDYRDSYYNDLMEFIDICDNLGIDICKEPLEHYTNEAVDALVCDYIVSNKELMVRVASGLNKNISPGLLKYISMLKLDDLSRLPEIVESITRTANEPLTDNELAVVTMRRFLDSGESNERIAYVKDEELFQFLLSYMQVTQVTNLGLNFNYMTTKNGFFFYKGAPLKLRLEGLYESIPGYGTDSLIHNKGFVILIPNREKSQIAYTSIGGATYGYTQILRGGRVDRNLWHFLG